MEHFLLEYSSEYRNEYLSTRSYRKYFNTSCQWRQTAYLGPEWSEPKSSTPLHVYIQIYCQTGKWSHEIAKAQVSINSNNSSIDCKTWNRNLQPEIVSNEYSSSKMCKYVSK